FYHNTYNFYSRFKVCNAIAVSLNSNIYTKRINMKPIALLVCLSLLFTSCKKDEKETKNYDLSQISDFNEVLKSYHEESLKLYPINATYAGDNRYNDYFNNFLSEEFIAQQ